MGKKRGGRRGGKAGSDDRSESIGSLEMSNDKLERYYKAQQLMDDDEWDKLVEKMREPLPTTFRVAGSRQTAQVLNDIIKTTHTQHLGQVVFEGETMSPPVQLPWYPDGLAWQFNVAKKVLRKSFEFRKFHSFLVYETEVGNISRQEAVSMIPPLLLDVEPHHLVIDMCAAPGSKTAQLLEALHAQDGLTASSTPRGLLIANDSDHKRAHLLIHQSARLPSPSLMVTNLDASIYPAIKIPAEDAESAPPEVPEVGAGGEKRRMTRSEKKRQGALLFDRILCDVPCSGDGTIRKNPGIWKHWNPMDGNGLHGLQLRILQRAMRMLKAGGRIVYSTCSLNPVENEAVIAAALASIPGFELIDVSDRLPGLHRRPGLTAWRPTVDKTVNVSFASFAAYLDSIPASKRPETKLTEGHWPPPLEEAERLGLKHCVRIYPHLQDTGGFFIAVLQKKPRPGQAPADPTATGSGETKKRQAESPAEPAEQEPDSKKARLVDDTDLLDASDELEDADAVDAAGAGVGADMDVDAAVPVPAPAVGTEAKRAEKEKGVDESFKENPYTFLPPGDASVQSCIDRLNLIPSFPSTNIFVRNPTGEAVRSLYLTNDIVRSIVQHNDYTRMRLVTCGTKLFVKQGADKSPDAQFRVLAEGLPVVMPYVKKETILKGSLAALRTLIEGYYPLCVTFTQAFRNEVEDKTPGSYIVQFPPEQWDGATITHDLFLPIWKSNVSVCLMIDKKAKSALSLRLFGEDVTVAARDASQRKKDEAVPAEADVPAAEDESTAVDAAEDTEVKETE